MKFDASLRSRKAGLYRALSTATSALALTLVATSLNAAAPDGQLWWTAQRFLTVNSTNDNQVGRINSDHSSQTITLINPDTTRYYVSVGLNTAAGLYFAIDVAFSDTAVKNIVVGNINTGAVIQTLNLNPADYAIEALAVNPKTHQVYVGIWGDGTADSGIIKLSYNPLSPTPLPTNVFSGSVITPSFYLTSEAGGSHETFASSMAIDVPNQKLYFTDEDINLSTGNPWGSPYFDTNGIYVIDLNSPTPTATQLTTSAQFPASHAGYATAVESVAIDPARSLVYFETTDLTNGATPNIKVWYMPIAGGTATQMIVPGSVVLNSTYYGTFALSPATHTLYLSTNGNSTTTPIQQGFIYALPLSADGHSFTSASTFAQVNSADPNLITDSLFFESIPTLTLIGTGTHASEQGAGVTLLTNGTPVSDADGVSLVSATVQITGGTFASNETSANDDHLAVPVNGSNKVLVDAGATTTNITATYTSATETLSLAGVDTIVNYNKALAEVAYNTTGDNPTNYGANTTRTLSWTVSDGTPSIPAGSPNSGTSTITIDAVNDAPVVTAGSTVSYTEQAAGVVIASALTLTDADNVNLVGATVSIGAAGFLAGDTLNFTNQNGITGSYNSGTGVLTLSSTPTTLANYQAALRSITFSSTSDDPTAGGTRTSRTISFVANDGTANSAAGTSTVNITAVNDAPVNTVPGAQSTVANTDLAIAGFSTSDVDGGSNSETTTLSVAHGTLTIASAGGAAVSGSGTASVTLSGSIAQINTTLAAASNVVYHSAIGFAGADTLTFATNDNGNTGTGGAKSDSDAVTINVIGPPTINKAFGASSIAVNGSTTLTFTLANANTATSLSGIGFTDNLPAGLTVSSPNGLSGSCGGGTITATAGSGSVSLSGATLAASANCSFAVNVSGITAGAKNNVTSAVTSNEGGTGLTASASVNVLAPPSIAKVFTPNSIAVNATTSLMFTITNPAGNPATLTGVGFNDTLPTGLTVATASTSTCGGTLTTTAPTGIVLAGASIASGAQCQFNVTVTGTASGQYTNTTGAVTSSNGGTGNTASANLTVASPPSISKVFGAATVPVNGTTSLTFNLSNPNSGLTLTGVAFTDNLPAGLVIASPNGLTGSCGGGTITATAGSGSAALAGATLASNASCSFSVNVTGTTAGTKSNSVTVTSTEGGNGNTSIANITVMAPATIAKAFGAPSIPLNASTSLTFTLANPNTLPLTGVGFTDNLPAGLTVSTPNGLSGSCGGGTITAIAGSSSVSLAGATLAAGANCSFAVNVTGIAAGTQNNVTSAVASTEGGPGLTASASINVIAAPSIAKVFTPNAIALNATTSLMFTITNPAGNPATLTGVGFSDTLPAGLTVVNAAVSTCGGTLTTTAPTSIVLAGASITSGAQCQFSVTVTGAASGQYTNTTGAVTSTNGGTGNTATANLSVAAPPSITKLFGAASIPLNGATSLTFNISNPNATLALTGIAFTDTLPAGLVIASPNGLSGTCGGGTITATAGSSSAALAAATLAANASCSFSVNVTGTTAGVKSNSVTVASTESGTGNTSIANITVMSPATLAKAFGAPSIPLNGSTSLTFTLANANTTSSLSGVAFTDNLPSGLTVSSPNGLSGSCGGGTVTALAGSGSVSLSGATLAANANCSFAVNVTGVAAGTLNNVTGAVTSTEGGTGLTASASINVVAPPSIAKVFAPTAIALNTTTSLTFTITNPSANTVALTGVGFTDTLPTGLTVANTSPATCGGTLTTTAPTGIALTGASIAPGAQCQFNVTVTGAASGQYTNTTGAVTSTNGGTGNTATANLSVASPPAITKQFGAPTIVLNGTTSVMFNITNPNTTQALSGVAFTDTLPAGLVIATPNGLTGSCGGGTITAVAGSGSAALAAATLAANTSCSFSVNVTGTTAGQKDNSVTVTSTDGGTGNTSNATVTVIAPPTIAKAFGAASVPLNGSTSLSFTLQNGNTTTTLTGIGFNDTLPAGLVISTPNGLSGSCGGGTITAIAATHSIALTTASLAANASCTFSVNVDGIAAGAQNNTTDAVISSEGGTGTTSNTATLSVVAAPAIAKAFSPAHIMPNQVTTLTFTITNPVANVDAENDVAFADTMPANVVVAGTPNVTNNCGGTVTAIGGSSVISLASANVASGSSCTLSVDTTATTGGQFTNVTGAVSSSNGGTGNTATANLTSLLAHLSVALDDGHGYARYGHVLNYLFTISNAGPTDVSDISIAETFSAEFEPSAAHWVCISGGGNESCTDSGSGPLVDANVAIPASRSLTWLISAPALYSTPLDTAVNTLTVTSPTDPNAPYTVSDSDILVLFRDGFDTFNADGTGSIATSAQAAPLARLPQPLSIGQTLTLTMPAKAGLAPVDTLLSARAGDGSGFRVERLNLGDTPRVRLVAIDTSGSERPSAWARTTASGLLMLALNENHGTEVELETTDAGLKISVAGNAQQGFSVEAVDESR